PRDTTVATLGIGYADGLRRALGLGGEAYVLLRGARCPVVGLVTMDYVMVETGGTTVQVGDVATLVGEADGGRIAIDQFAAWSGELQREFLTGLGARRAPLGTWRGAEGTSCSKCGESRAARQQRRTAR